MALKEISIVGPSQAAPMLQPQQDPIMSIIERAARDPSVDIDKLERLLEMQERVAARNAKGSFAASLAEMQAELPVINRRGLIEVRKKDASGDRTGAVQQATPYALWEDINEAIKPILAKHGFALSFRTGTAPDGRITVTGILSHREGHQEETTMTLMHDSTGSKNAVQAMGSSVSYGKRYTASALLNLTSRGEDDDGRKAGDPPTITDDQTAKLRDLVESVGANLGKFLQFFKIEKLADLPAARFQEAVNMLNAKAKG